MNNFQNNMFKISTLMFIKINQVVFVWIWAMNIGIIEYLFLGLFYP